MKFLGRMVALTAIGLIAIGFSPAAKAAVILEKGPNYHVIQYDAGRDGEAGSVTLRVEVIPDESSSATIAVLTTVESVSPSEGWTFDIKKDGGIDASVEVEFSNDQGCSVRFKARYVPGKTVVDSGAVRCK